MSLLKSLQQKLSSVSVPWDYRQVSASTRLINEIILDEESDTDEQGQVCSHFQMYLTAMEEVGANTEPVLKFLDRLGKTGDIVKAVQLSQLSEAVRYHLIQTMQFTQMSTHELAAVFTYGREDIVPKIFLAILEEPSLKKENHWGRLRYYLQRHVDLDDNRHGPLAKQMVQILCGQDSQKWHQAEQAIQKSLASRLSLWNFIEQQCRSNDALTA